MGREITTTDFSNEDYKEFEKKLRDESRILREWFDAETFEKTEGNCGLELEAWLVDRNFDPYPENEEFLKRINNPLVVPELAKFNVEINSTPCRIGKNFLSVMEKELSCIWEQCEKHANNMEGDILAIGIHPKIKNKMLILENMSSMRRYAALNQQVLKLRDGKSLKLNIEGHDRLKIEHHDVMLEATTTSLQIHIQVSQSLATRHYNIAQIISAPMVAVSANSPYLFGNELWDETRIPVFEQSVEVSSFRDCHGDNVGRVHFGTGFLRNSLFEAFLENLDGFPVLLPLVTDDDPNWLNHLRLHNGTIWRWNRPLIGLDKVGKPHLRIEHRVVPSGPTITDTIANIAFFVGLDRYFISQEDPLEDKFVFEDVKNNFYAAAKNGLNAKIKWKEGKLISMQSLLLDTLLPAAKEGLLAANIDKSDVAYYIDEVMARRVLLMRNGAIWQKEFIKQRGRDFHEMICVYHENQKQNIPVHSWKV
ncbi:MAG: hypothetical protein H8E32_09480 [Nitrospinae bacterium]|nr:hypothetical protein [Nitrospinota bacterium]